MPDASLRVEHPFFAFTVEIEVGAPAHAAALMMA
jgi:hypothetical protein